MDLNVDASLMKKLKYFSHKERSLPLTGMKTACESEEKKEILVMAYREKSANCRMSDIIRENENRKF